jgi:hypothetical protein
MCVCSSWLVTLVGDNVLTCCYRISTLARRAIITSEGEVVSSSPGIAKRGCEWRRGLGGSIFGGGNGV